MKREQSKTTRRGIPRCHAFRSAISRLVALLCVFIAPTLRCDAEKCRQGDQVWTYAVKGNEITITGIGKRPSGELFIPFMLDGKRVRHIGAKVFENSPKLKKVTIPNGITSIGARAFAGCGSLKSVEIPKSVKSIAGDAFADCPLLKKASKPDKSTARPERPVTSGNDTRQRYLVIDISGGASADSYPVSYLDSVPKGGWTDEYKTTKIVLRRIYPGSFMMGSPAEEEGRTARYETWHKVRISKPYYIGVFEVTQKQYELVTGKRPVRNSNFTGDLRPVSAVSWNAIRLGDIEEDFSCRSVDVGKDSFLGKLRAKTQIDSFDLPTEAQWEYACRAGSMTAFADGGEIAQATRECDFLGKMGRYYFNGGDAGSVSDHMGGYDHYHTAVGSYRPNAWGLYDMHGNVLEWCLDDYMEFEEIPVVDPLGKGSRTHVLKGGSYCEYAVRCRCARRGYEHSSKGFMNLGFRISCEAKSWADERLGVNGLSLDVKPAGSLCQERMFPEGIFF